MKFNNKASFKFIFPTLLLGLVCGCKKFVDVPAPTSKLVTASVFNNTASATAALTSIYSQMQLESYNMSWSNGKLSDEFIMPNSDAFYTNSMQASQNPGPWDNAYFYIYQANAVIEGLQKYSGVGQASKAQLTGEAKFLRAFWHFYLVNCYGDVPLVTTTDYTVNSAIGRSPKDQVYQQIISDLTDAQDLLNSGYVDASDTSVISNRIRPNKSAATALLARVYLYNAEYTEAETQASTVIGNTSMYSLATDLNSAFEIDNAEAIWQLGLPSDRSSTFDAYYYILQGAPGDVALSDWLLNAFEPGDLRRQKWVDSITTSGTFYFPNKYKARDVSNTPPNEEVMMLRLAEQYLIRAEARIQQNNVAGAIDDLNVLRQRARDSATASVPNPLPALDPNMSKDNALKALLHERQTELFTEWGHRWFDMIRLGFISSIMGTPGNICLQKGGVWATDNHQVLYPIPQTSIQSNINLKQNPGY